MNPNAQELVRSHVEQLKACRASLCSLRPRNLVEKPNHKSPRLQTPTAKRLLVNLAILFLPNLHPAAAFQPSLSGSFNLVFTSPLNCHFAQQQLRLQPSLSHWLGSGQSSGKLSSFERHIVQGKLGSMLFSGSRPKRIYNKAKCLLNEKPEDLLQQKPEDRKNEAIMEYTMGAIAECERNGQWEQIGLMLKTMASKSLTPEVISFNAAISACEKSGRWEQALRFLERVSTTGLIPNSASFDIAIAACKKYGKWEKTISLLREMNAEIKTSDAT